MASLSPAAAGDDPTEPTPVRPYGLIGLVISVVLILVATLAVLVVAAACAFGVASLLQGAHAALQWVADFPRLAESEKGFQQRAGVVLSLILYAALSAVVLAAARLKGGSQWRKLVGWHAWHPLRGARLFWLIAALAIAYGLAADAVVSWLYPPSREWVTLPAGSLWTALFIVLAVLFAPVTEELFFRGWIYTGLRLAIGSWAGILVSAALFALAHWEKTHLYALIVFPVGIMLGFVRENAASVKASMTLHALFNGAASVALLLGS